MRNTIAAILAIGFLGLILWGTANKHPDVSAKDLQDTIAKADKTLQEIKTWRVSHDKDEIDGSTFAMLSLWSESMKEDLTLRCHQERFQAFISTDELVDHENYVVSVRMRLDDFKPSMEHWSPAKGSKGMFIPEPRTLVQDLVISKTMLIEYSDFGSETHRAKFNVEGLKDKLPELSACKVKG